MAETAKDKLKKAIDKLAKLTPKIEGINGNDRKDEEKTQTNTGSKPAGS